MIKRIWNHFKNNYLWQLRRVPKVLQVEITNRCNSNCEVCPRRELDLDLKTMRFGEFYEIVESLKKYKGQISEFHPYRMGEPTLNPDLIYMCRLAKNEIGCDIVIYTNGSGLSESMIDQLFSIPIKKLVFSVEGFGKKQYEKLRQGMSWEHLCNMIDYTSNRNRYTICPEVIIRYTKYKDNGSIGRQYRKRFPHVDQVIGREYVDNEIKTIPELPCRILKTHMVIDAHRDLLMCCCGIKDNRLATWEDYLHSYRKDLVQFWRDKRKPYKNQKSLDNMPSCCNYCGVDVINKDERWD